MLALDRGYRKAVYPSAVTDDVQQTQQMPAIIGEGVVAGAASGLQSHGGGAPHPRWVRLPCLPAKLFYQKGLTPPGLGCMQPLYKPCGCAFRTFPGRIRRRAQAQYVVRLHPFRTFPERNRRRTQTSYVMRMRAFRTFREISNAAIESSFEALGFRRLSNTQNNELQKENI